jgi:hypothetical protein
MQRTLLLLALLLIPALALLYVAGEGDLASDPTGGTPQAPEASAASIAERAERVTDAAERIGVAAPRQILFGDLHVHSTFSFDAFQMSLPMAGGDGAHPVADACDFARHCSALDFWSINDHAMALSDRRWRETVDTIRQCNAVASDPNNPDTVAYLGWEWTQVGWTAEKHWGHKNVILRDLDDERIPARPISSGIPEGTPPVEELTPSPFVVGALALWEWNEGGPALARYLQETAAIRNCPDDVPVRDLPLDCRENAPTPKQLFAKLDDWDHEALVIPHGTTWGFYTPLGSSWDKQLAPGQHNPRWQSLIEVMSGHGNSEEFRPFREVIDNPDGTRTCPAPNENFLPSCWRAGEIITGRCLAEGGADDECDARGAVARQHFADAYRNGGGTVVPGATLEDWQDAGQCRDCFQPSFNYRPRSSVQYILGLSRPEQPDGTDRFRFGFIAASDNHSARPGTGYKESARSEFTEARFGNFIDTPMASRDGREPAAHSEEASREFSTEVFSVFETERGSSFFLNGGLAAVHSEGRSREEIWEAMQRREVYGTSGPRILLWFDLLNAPGGKPAHMGSQVALDQPPVFQVRAVGSYVQKPGCPPDASDALGADRLDRLCRGECYHPTDERRPITRIEVVRIRPQLGASEAIAPLIEDPWQVLECPGDPAGCQVAFADTEFVSEGRDAVYYVRAIEAPSQAVGADPLGCQTDESGRCVAIDPCSRRPEADECLGETEERAWSSPIYIDQPAPREAAVSPQPLGVVAVTAAVGSREAN